MTWQARRVRRIDEISPAAWNDLAQIKYPFLRHEFLDALERTHCLGKQTGWLPCHLGIFEEDTQLTAAIPLYLKLNSFGEFVFDWAWAGAYRRSGINYYPKLVATVPFTPATSPKVLITPGQDNEKRFNDVIDSAIEMARSLDVSSLHWLFTPAERLTSRHGLLTRMGCQFHWTNRGYRDFEHFLDHFKSRKRKQIKKERRQVTDAGVQLERIAGSEVTSAQWDDFHELYRSTFVKY
ncbi:MAG: peptidogalycan biosysnthesis protein, partial [Pseudomonadota bacterium]